MGLDPNSLRFVLHAQAAGVDYARTLMIGRQRLNLGASELHDALAEFRLATTRDATDRIYTSDDRFADGLFRFLGATEVAALDNSPYQGASFVHDLNVPIGDEQWGRFSAVVDCGTLEHIFDVPTALGSCMRMVAEGGHYLCVVPANNFLGHGFYQFSPEFFYRVLSPVNGFSIKSCVVFTDDTIGRWYSVTDPDQLGRRVTLCNSRPTYIGVLAERTSIVEPFRQAPQQSDYVRIWDESAAPDQLAPKQASTSGGFRIARLVPDSIKAPARRRLAGIRRRINRRGRRGLDSQSFKAMKPTDMLGATNDDDRRSAD